MTTTVVGRVSNAREAENVVQDLASTCSCDRADISLLTQNGTGEAEADKAGFGPLKGIAAGTVIGAIAGYAVVAAAVPVPEVFSSVVAHGPIASAIMGAFIGGVALGVMGALVSAVTGGQETDDPGNARHPGTLITVHARNDRQAACVVNVMKQHAVMEIDKRSSDWVMQDPSNRSTMEDPLMRADPKLSTVYSPPMGGPSLRNNRLPETSAAKVISRAGWITRQYTATYYGPERRFAANQSPYQGAERRQSA